MRMSFRLLGFLLAIAGTLLAAPPDPQDLEKVLAKADALLDEAKSAYETARSQSSAPLYVEAGFKLEEARIKYLAVQEIGEGEKQKVAVERLRAVNQLAKLIHDGKVAITGSSAEGGSRPEVPKPPGEPAGEPKPPTSPAPVEPVAPDITKRHPVPDAAKQKEAERLVRDLFKEQYAKKSPADRKALSRTLLEHAKQSTDDPAALWVLYREAMDMSIQGCDAASLTESIDGAARFFDVDAMPIRSSSLAAAGKNAKTPEEFGALAVGLQVLIDDFIRADQYDAAEKAAATSLQFAKIAKNVDLIARATGRQKEVGEAKTLFASMKSVLQGLAKNPDDPAANLEMGKFLCYVKGTWDLGLRFMAKGSDPELRGLAEREIANPVQSADLLAIADGWWDLAEKDKSPLRKIQMQTHCGALYDAALPGATALVKIRIQKRMDSLGSRYTPAGGIDLLRLVDLKADVVKGKWKTEPNGLFGIGPDGGELQLPYILPAEYDILYMVERINHGDFLVLGLTGESTSFSVVIDVAGRSLIELVDGFNVNGANPTIGKGYSFPTGRAVPIKASVRKTGVTVTVDGSPHISYQGPLRRLTPNPDWAIPNAKLPYLGSIHGGFRFQSVNLIPVAEPGKKYR